MRGRRSDWQRMRSSHARVLDGLAAAVATHPSGSARPAPDSHGTGVVTFRPRSAAGPATDDGTDAA